MDTSMTPQPAHSVQPVSHGADSHLTAYNPKRSRLSRLTVPRRVLALSALVVLLTGCAQTTGSNTARPHCFRNHHLLPCKMDPETAANETPVCFQALKLSTCVPAPGATPDQASQVRRVAPRTDSGRIVVVRGQWGDLKGVADPTLGGTPLQQMIPYSAIAVDVSAGRHELSAGGGAAPTVVDVATGGVVAYELRRRLDTENTFDLVPLGRQEAQTLMQGIKVLGLFDRTVASADASRP